MALTSVQQRRDLLTGPDVIRHARRHGRGPGIRIAKALVWSPEVDPHHVQAHRRRIDLGDRLGSRVAQHRAQFFVMRTCSSGSEPIKDVVTDRRATIAPLVRWESLVTRSRSRTNARLPHLTGVLVRHPPAKGGGDAVDQAAHLICPSLWSEPPHRMVVEHRGHRLA